MQNNETQWREWIGRSESSQDNITSFPMAAMAATLDKPVRPIANGEQLPPLWHWLYFLETSPRCRLAADGHAEKGAFLPPIALPRRMWAGSRVEFLQPLHVGDRAERESTVKDIRLKQGRSGQLAFVTVAHCITGPGGVALREEHDIVYREHAAPDAAPPPAQPAPTTAAYTRTHNPDAVLLFRYSALTFNSHRIHYDRDFTRSAEAYPGLVVHGPLLATLMLDLVVGSLPAAHVQRFEFKALRPVFDLHPFTVCADVPDQQGNARLWVQDHTGALCMSGSAQLKVS